MLSKSLENEIGINMKKNIMNSAKEVKPFDNTSFRGAALKPYVLPLFWVVLLSAD